MCQVLSLTWFLKHRVHNVLGLKGLGSKASGFRVKGFRVKGFRV